MQLTALQTKDRHESLYIFLSVSAQGQYRYCVVRTPRYFTSWLLLLQIRVGWKHVKMTFVLLAIMLKTEPFRGSKPGQELYMRHDGQSVIVCRQAGSTVAPHSSYDQNGILPSSVAKAPCCSTTGQPAGAVRTDQEDFSIHSSGFRSYSGALGWQHMPLPVLYWRYFRYYSGAGWQTYMFYRDDWDPGSPIEGIPKMLWHRSSYSLSIVFNNKSSC